MASLGLAAQHAPEPSLGKNHRHRHPRCAHVHELVAADSVQSVDQSSTQTTSHGRVEGQARACWGGRASRSASKRIRCLQTQMLQLTGTLAAACISWGALLGWEGFCGLFHENYGPKWSRECQETGRFPPAAVHAACTARHLSGIFCCTVTCSHCAAYADSKEDQTG